MPEWRAILMRIIRTRGVRPGISDEDLARAVRFEFESPGSEVWGYHCVVANISPSDGPPFSRVVLTNPKGQKILVDAPTEAEALGRALAQHLEGKKSPYFSSMSASNRRLVCERLEVALRNLVREYAGQPGGIRAFVDEVLKMEEKAIQPAGLVLTVTDTLDGWICFSLHIRGAGDICARFECRLETGEIRRKR